MKVTFNQDKLYKLLKSFNILTGIRIVIFDNDFNEVVSYPPYNCELCKKIQEKEYGKSLCMKSNENAFAYCSCHDDLFTYHCHAGLVESMISLKVDSKNVGFIMFGQISDIKDETLRIKHLCQNDIHSDMSQLIESIKKITYKSSEEIEATSLILLTLAKYTANEKLVAITKDQFVSQLDQVINNNLSNVDLDVDLIAHEMNMCKTYLYNMAKKYLKIGVAEYIKEKRLDEACALLKDNSLSITKISEMVGFRNYNYFSKVFSDTYHITCREYRKSFIKNV